MAEYAPEDRDGESSVDCMQLVVLAESYRDGAVIGAGSVVTKISAHCLAFEIRADRFVQLRKQTVSDP